MMSTGLGLTGHFLSALQVNLEDIDLKKGVA